MKQVKIIAIGDNVVDQYLSRGMMYPGGQCVNTCVYAIMNGAAAAYLGKFGSDGVAAYNQQVLGQLGIDISRCRRFEGENGYAKVTLQNGDRVFLGSNKGGVAKEHPFGFGPEDVAYIQGFDVIYTNLNSYIEADLPLLQSTGVPVVYDFSTRWTDEYLQQVCPYIQIATLSCAHLSDAEREREMKKAQALGVPVVLGTVGENGSYLLYKNQMLYAPAVNAREVKDTMGAGDSYFAAFLVSLLAHSPNGALLGGLDEALPARLEQAMQTGAAFAARVCNIEGAFGHGTPIVE